MGQSAKQIQTNTELNKKAQQDTSNSYERTKEKSGVQQSGSAGGCLQRVWEQSKEGNHKHTHTHTHTNGDLNQRVEMY